VAFYPWFCPHSSRLLRDDATPRDYPLPLATLPLPNDDEFKPSLEPELTSLSSENVFGATLELELLGSESLDDAF